MDEIERNLTSFYNVPLKCERFKTIVTKLTTLKLIEKTDKLHGQKIDLLPIMKHIPDDMSFV